MRERRRPCVFPGSPAAAAAAPDRRRQARPPGVRRARPAGLRRTRGAPGGRSARTGFPAHLGGPRPTRYLRPSGPRRGFHPCRRRTLSRWFAAFPRRGRRPRRLRETSNRSCAAYLSLERRFAGRRASQGRRVCHREATERASRLCRGTDREDNRPGTVLPATTARTARRGQTARQSTWWIHSPTLLMCGADTRLHLFQLCAPIVLTVKKRCHTLMSSGAFQRCRRGDLPKPSGVCLWCACG